MFLMNLCGIIKVLCVTVDCVNVCVDKYRKFNDILNLRNDYDKIMCYYASVYTLIKWCGEELDLKFNKNVLGTELKRIDKGIIPIDDQHKERLTSILDKYREVLTELRDHISELQDHISELRNGIRDVVDVQDTDEFMLKRGVVHQYISDFIDDLNDILDIRYQFELTSNIDNTNLDDLIQLSCERKFSNNDIMSY